MYNFVHDAKITRLPSLAIFQIMNQDKILIFYYGIIIRLSVSQNYPSYLYNNTHNYLSTYILETRLQLPILYFTLTL
jgi:hypothetical protein